MCDPASPQGCGAAYEACCRRNLHRSTSSADGPPSSAHRLPTQIGQESQQTDLLALCICPLYSRLVCLAPAELWVPNSLVRQTDVECKIILFLFGLICLWICLKIQLVILFINIPIYILNIGIISVYLYSLIDWCWLCMLLDKRKVSRSNVNVWVWIHALVYSFVPTQPIIWGWPYKIHAVDRNGWSVFVFEKVRHGFILVWHSTLHLLVFYCTSTVVPGVRMTPKFRSGKIICIFFFTFNRHFCPKQPS